MRSEKRLTQKQCHVLRYLMAQEASESGLCFKDARCIARGIFGFGSYDAALAQFVKLKYRQPETILPALLRDDARMLELHELPRKAVQSAERPAKAHSQVPGLRGGRRS